MSMQPAAASLSEDQISSFYRDGYLLLPGHLPASLLDRISAELPALHAEDAPQRIVERDGRTVRSVYGPHLTNAVIGRAVRHPALLSCALGVLGGDVYVHQSKVNWKAAFVGDVWEWHQDFIYWLRDDGIQRPELVNVAVFLDEVTEFNGPLTLVPGSHAHGIVAFVEGHGMPEGYEGGPAWVSTLTAREKYGVAQEVVAALVRQRGMHSPKGPAGSVLLFHPNILHASSPNISPFGRATLILVYNRADNLPVGVDYPRPDFLASHDTRPLEPLMEPV